VVFHTEYTLFRHLTSCVTTETLLVKTFMQFRAVRLSDIPILIELCTHSNGTIHLNLNRCSHTFKIVMGIIALVLSLWVRATSRDKVRSESVLRGSNGNALLMSSEAPSSLSFASDYWIGGKCFRATDRNVVSAAEL
jgi:hypothetical protein